MAYCTRCGQVVNEGDTFCSGCGVGVVAAAEADLDKIEIEIEKTRRHEKVGWVLMIAAVILEGIGGWLLLGPTATRTESHGALHSQAIYHPYGNAGDALVFLGMLLVLIGGGLCVYWSLRQSRLMRKLKPQ